MNRFWMDFAGVAGASVIATAADGVVFWAFSTFGMRAGIAALLAAIVGGVIHFSLCRWGVFKRFNANVLQSAGRYVVMSGIAALLQAGIVEFLVADLGHGLAWGIGKVLIYMGWTFPLSRWIVFKGSRS
jgi:putative flippase GtrA